MDLVYILRELWLRRRWVILGALLSAAVSLAVAFEVSLVPPSLSSRSLEHGTARTQVLVDTRPSTLADTGSDYEPLITRAGVYGQLFATGPVRRQVSAQSGIPADLIEIDAPSAGKLVTPDGSSADQEGDGADRASQSAAENSRYRLALDVETELPIISIFAEAPDEAEAVRLANGAAEGLRRYISSLNPVSPEGRRVSIRVLGDAASGTVGEGASASVAALAGVAFFIGWCLLMLLASNLARRWRAASAGLGPMARRAPEGRAGEEPIPASIEPSLQSPPRGR